MNTASPRVKPGGTWGASTARLLPRTTGRPGDRPGERCVRPTAGRKDVHADDLQVDTRSPERHVDLQDARRAAAVGTADLKEKRSGHAKNPSRLPRSPPLERSGGSLGREACCHGSGTRTRDVGRATANASVGCSSARARSGHSYHSVLTGSIGCEIDPVCQGLPALRDVAAFTISSSRPMATGSRRTRVMRPHQR